MHIRHIDTCLPCYFQGCDRPYIQIPVTGSTKKTDLESEMISEWNGGFIANEDQLIGDTDAINEKVIAAIKSFCSDLPNIPFPDLDVVEDDDDRTDFVYAYFVIDPED